MANSTLKCRINILITAMSLCSYNNILINVGQLYSNSCYTTFSITTLGMCIACEFHQLGTARPCIYHIFQHLTKWLIFCRTDQWPCMYSNCTSCLFWKHCFECWKLSQLKIAQVVPSPINSRGNSFSSTQRWRT